MPLRTAGEIELPVVTSTPTPPRVGWVLAYARAAGLFLLNSGGSETYLGFREEYATTVTTSAAGTATVTFPAGRFASAPVITLTPETNSPTTEPIVCNVVSGTRTATSVQIRALRYGGILGWSGTATTVHVSAKAAG